LAATVGSALVLGSVAGCMTEVVGAFEACACEACAFEACAFVASGC